MRRLTGGGAIVHDAELTYSLVVPGGHPLAARRNTLYETVHASLIDVLADWGIVSTVCRPAGPRRQGQEPFLCFHRRAPGDVLVDQTKVAGSAQRRRRRAVLQHGSVLLRRSHAAPELDGLEDLSGKTIGSDELAEAWQARLFALLGVTWRNEPLSQRQQRLAAALAESRYGSTGWNVNRSR